MVNHHSTNRRIRSVWTGPQSPVGHVCQTAVVALCVLILVFAPLAFGAVRLWALGPILIAIGLAGVLWIVRILSTQEMSVVFSTLGPSIIALTAYAVTANPHDALGKRELAGERYQRAIQADPQNATYRAQLALHYQSWGDTDNAVASFARAYELDVDDPVPEIELQRLSKLGT